MKTISAVVENYIKTKPFLLSALSQGIINLTSLSRNMLPELQQELGKPLMLGFKLKPNLSVEDAESILADLREQAKTK